MKFGLSEQNIRRINTVFASFSQVNEVIVYGSRAKGNFRPGSDIDLTLKGDGLTLDVVNKISMQLDDLLLPYLIDLSVFSHIENKDLIEHINRAGLSFYKKDKG